MPFATFSRNPLVSNRFTHFFHQPHYALSFYAPYMQRKEIQKEKVNTMFKEYFYSLFLCSRPIIHFFEQYIPLVHTYNPLVTNIIYHQQHYTFNFLGFFLHNGAEL